MATHDAATVFPEADDQNKPAGWLVRFFPAALGVFTLVGLHCLTQSTRRRDTAAQYWQDRLPESIYRSYTQLGSGEVLARFDELAQLWRRDTSVLSNLELRFNHPIYRRLIAVGQPVVPLLLRSLDDDPLDWVWALETIVGKEAPRVEPPHTAEGTRDAWLAWGKQRGYV